MQRGLLALILGASPSKHALKLTSMLNSLALHDSTLAFVALNRDAALLRGVQRAIKVPEVSDAFTVLYEDLIPVRLAGDRMYKTLQRSADDAARKEAFLRDVAPFTADELTTARRIFDLIDVDGNGAIDRDELVASGIVNWMGKDSSSIDSVLEDVDQDGDGKISFFEFMLANARLLYPDIPSDGREFLPPEFIATKMNEAESTLRQRIAPRSNAQAEIEDARDVRASAFEKRRVRANKRFDQMLDTFQCWSDSGICGDESSRLGRVLTGCFVGSRDREVVATLRLCYTEFRPLRIAAELIFRLMSQVSRSYGFRG